MSNTSTSAKRLNSTALPSITGFEGKCAAIAQPKDRRTVADDRDEISTRRILKGVLRPHRDFQHRVRYAGRVGQREVLLRLHRLGRRDFSACRAGLWNDSRVHPVLSASLGFSAL